MLFLVPAPAAVTASTSTSALAGRLLIATLLAVGSVLPRPTNAQPARALVTRAVEAAGGEQALRAVESVTVGFVSVTFGHGQEETPDSPARATTLSGRITADYRGNRRVLVQETRPGAGPTGVTRTRQVMTAGAGMSDVNGTQTPLTAAVLAATTRGMRLQPERLLLLALDNPASLRAPTAPTRAWRRETLDGARLTVGPDTVTLYFDRLNGLLTMVEAVTDDPVLGDRTTLTAYTRWTPTGSVKLARQIDVFVNDRLQSHTIIASGDVNTRLDDSVFVAPDSIMARSRAALANPVTPVGVSLASLAPGVWRAEGGSHHSLVVEQDDGLLVIEAPQNAERSRAVLDTLRRRFAGRAVRQVVATHHHWDHSGGLREYMSQAIPVVAHVRNVGFLRQIGMARKTVAPDRLSRERRAPIVVALRDSLVIGTGDRRVVLYELRTTHAEGLLAAYVPAHRLLFTSDVLTPGPTLAQVGSAELVALARSRGLAVDRFVGGHGGVAPWADVERAAGRP